MTALRRENAIISSVPSIIANPKIVNRRLYKTNEINSTTGKADNPTKTTMNNVAIGYSMTKANTGATMRPTFVSFHF